MVQQSSVRGLAIAPLVCDMVGLDERGHGVLGMRLARCEWLHGLATRAPALRGRAADGRAHAWARRCGAQGHHGRWLAPPARQARQRGRARRLKARTAGVPARRGRRRADGRVVRPGVSQCRPAVVGRIEADPAQRPPLRPAVCGPLAAAWRAVAHQVADAPEPRQARGQAPPPGRRWPARPGLGPLTATALQADVPTAPHGTPGGQGAAWLGRVRRAHATGGTSRRLGRRPRGARAPAARSWGKGPGRHAAGWCCSLPAAGHGAERAAPGGGTIARRSRAWLGWSGRVWPLITPTTPGLPPRSGRAPPGRLRPHAAKRRRARLTSAVGPAAPHPAVRPGRRGRHSLAEGKRGWPQGQPGGAHPARNRPMRCLPRHLTWGAHRLLAMIRGSISVATLLFRECSHL
jgi:hypothetical protein